VKVLSLWEPWASLVIFGVKRIETRSWATEYRGPLVIHASKKVSREQIEICHRDPFRSALRACGIDRWQDFKLGAAIGTVTLVDCRRIESDADVPSDDDPEYWFGNYAPGRFGWILKRPEVFATAIALRGRQGLFDVAPEEIGMR